MSVFIGNNYWHLRELTYVLKIVIIEISGYGSGMYGGYSGMYGDGFGGEYNQKLIRGWNLKLSYACYVRCSWLFIFESTKFETRRKDNWPIKVC